VTSLDPQSAPSSSKALHAPGIVPRRWVLLGTGTDVGKTWVAESLLRLLASRRIPAAGLKPIETGCEPSASGEPRQGDAARLEAASFDARHPRPHPRYAFVPPVTPSLAARRARTAIDAVALAAWVKSARRASSDAPICCVIESAGGAFSPVTDELSNRDLATHFGDAEWILVAPDRLGVLHDLRATLLAMIAAGRSPDWIVLNAPERADASSGTNAQELQRMGIQIPILRVARNEPSALVALLDGSPGA
jgi:dethiobiotin synthetase